MCITIFSNDATVAFTRVFMPRPSEVIPGSVTNVHDGALLFLQYDWIIINLSCALWAYLILSTNRTFSISRVNAIQATFVILSTLIVGPAATVCYALWLSEGDMRKQYVKVHAVKSKDAKAHVR